MTATFDIDEELELAGLDDEKPLVCGVPGCTDAVVKPARGPAPKYCPKHKRTGVRPNNKSAASGKSWPKATEIESHLVETLQTSLKITTLFPVDPFYAEHTAEAAPKVIHELVELAKDDRKLQAWLTTLAAPGKYGPLSMAVFGLVGPMFVYAAAKKTIAKGGGDSE